MVSQVLVLERMEELPALDRSRCPCDRCKDAREAGMSWEERLPLQRMSLCPTCSNKRCPKAMFHENQCTGSNAVGQVGSTEVVDQITHPCCQKCVSLQRDLDSANRRCDELVKKTEMLFGTIEVVNEINRNLESKLAMRDLLDKVDG